MLLPTHSQSTPARPTNLAEAVARACWPRNHATTRLEPHRDELLRLRQAGESVESLVGGLRLLGVEIGGETLRLWLNRELGRRPPKRRRAPGRSRQPPPVAESPAREPATPEANPPAPLAATTAPRTPAVCGGANDLVQRSTSLILPGETPLEALRRRLAKLDAQKAAARAAHTPAVGTGTVEDSIPPA